jgi:hypothetical protein
LELNFEHYEVEERARTKGISNGPTQTSDPNRVFWSVCVGYRTENGRGPVRLASASSGPTHPVRIVFFSCFKFKPNKNRCKLN